MGSRPHSAPDVGQHFFIQPSQNLLQLSVGAIKAKTLYKEWNHTQLSVLRMKDYEAEESNVCASSLAYAV